MSNRDIDEFGYEWHEILHLDGDEQEHLSQVSPDVERRCVLARDGARLIAGCINITPALETVEASSPEFVKALLSMRCANLLRLSVTAILTGYYTGTAVLLRTAFESLVYLHLFDDDAAEIGLWLKPELHPHLGPMERDRLRREQLNRAKDAFVRRAPGEQHDRELMHLLWDKTSRHIHSSVVGLAQTFGLDFKDFLPDDFWLALESSGNDWGLALDLISLRSTDGKQWLAGKREAAYPSEEIGLTLTGRYDEDEARLLSELALFLARRLGELTFRLFNTDEALKADHGRWRTEVMRNDSLPRE